MNEWGVVGVIIALVTFGIAVGKPIITLNSSIVKLTDEVANIIKGLNDFKKRYTDHLAELKTADSRMQNKIDDHERRITILEYSDEDDKKA